MQELSPLCEQTLHALLYGNRELSGESNEHICISVHVHAFLIKTNDLNKCEHSLIL